MESIACSESSHKNISPSNQTLVSFNCKYVKQEETLLLPAGRMRGGMGHFTPNWLTRSLPGLHQEQHSDEVREKVEWRP